MKFSIIIPIYNVEEFIKECLDSVMSQTFKDYEVIAVNDGTKDNSMDIVKKYKVKIINQENGGLSSARNTGVKHAKGEYIIFLDSDDTIERDLLKKLDTATKDKPDIVRFQIQELYDDKTKKEFQERGFDTCSGVEAFSKICTYHFVENAWCYAIKRDYYLKEKFKFAKGTTLSEALTQGISFNLPTTSILPYNVPFNFAEVALRDVVPIHKSESDVKFF